MRQRSPRGDRAFAAMQPVYPLSGRTKSSAGSKPTTRSAKGKQILEIEKDTRRSTQAIENSIQTGLQNPNATVRDIKSSAETTNMQVDVDDVDF